MPNGIGFSWELNKKGIPVLYYISGAIIKTHIFKSGGIWWCHVPKYPMKYWGNSPSLAYLSLVNNVIMGMKL